jgi:RNA polymerase sigma factor for flagellar operon FliA
MTQAAPPTADPRLAGRDALIQGHRRYARSLARQIAKTLPRGVEFDELAGFAELGLVEAANQFDATHGVAFTTFAYYRIRGAVFDGLRKMTWLPPAARGEITRQSGENDAIAQTADHTTAGGGPADDPAVAAKQFEEAVKRLGAVFLMSQASESDRPADPADHHTPAKTAQTRDLIARMKHAIEMLPDPQGAILRMHYFEDQTMTDIATQLGKDKSTVSRQHAKALDALKEALDD